MNFDTLEGYFLDVLRNPKKYSEKLHYMAMKFAMYMLEEYQLGHIEYNDFLIGVFGPRR